MFNSLFRPICGCLILLLLSSCGSPPPAQTKKKKTRIQPQHTASGKDSPHSNPAAPAEKPTESSPQPPSPQYRPDDRRPVHDDTALEQAGIRLYQSRHLKLYTDIDPAIAEKLPPLVDQLYAALIDYFGPMPSDRQGTEFQITGYLMRDEAVFREAGLLESVPLIVHGRHIANRFWMRHQPTEYFTQHLLLHECTHCFMTFVPGYAAPHWYSEGMAELFATHSTHPDGKTVFRILPNSDEEVPGWGRIPSIRRDIAAGKGLTIAGVEHLADPDYFQPQAYAWAWALCYFLDAHPRFQPSFRELSKHLRDGHFADKCRELFAASQMDRDWQLFAQHLQYGYNLPRALIATPIPEHVAESGEKVVTVFADRGWQDSGIMVESGGRYEITASGQFTLADHPKPWLSEPQGVTIDYFEGHPLGKLVACIEPAPDDTNPSPSAPADRLRVRTHLTAWKIVPIGKQQIITAPYRGRLLLRLNDAWNSLDDNTGQIEVRSRRAN